MNLMIPTVELISIKVSEVDNSVPYNDVRCFAEDQDGYIWLGTQNGPIVYISIPEDVLASDVSASRIKGPEIRRQERGVDSVWKMKLLTGIAVDGGNRKWMATANSGAFLVSSDGKKQI
jgi:ligand-binding sensor domain-containing protein